MKSLSLFGKLILEFSQDILVSDLGRHLEKFSLNSSNLFITVVPYIPDEDEDEKFALNMSDY